MFYIGFIVSNYYILRTSTACEAVTFVFRWNRLVPQFVVHQSSGGLPPSPPGNVHPSDPPWLLSPASQR